MSKVSFLGSLLFGATVDALIPIHHLNFYIEARHAPGFLKSLSCMSAYRVCMRVFACVHAP